MSKTTQITEEQLKRLEGILTGLCTDCDLALLDRWDRSDDGFQTMLDATIEAGEILGLTISSEADSLAEEDDDEDDDE